MKKRDTYKNFKEQGDGYLLAAAWIINSRNSQNTFEEIYKKIEPASLKIKNTWLQNISNRGNTGVDELNKVTIDCENNLGDTKTTIFKEISLYIHADGKDYNSNTPSHIYQKKQ